MAFDSSKAGFDKYYGYHSEKAAGIVYAGEPPYTPPRTAPIRLGYTEWRVANGAHRGYGARQLAADMKVAIGLDNAPVALIGAGFAYTAEGLVAAGTQAVVGTDISTWIQSAKDTSEEQDIRDYCAASGIDPDVHMLLCREGTPNAQFLDGKWRIRPLDWYLPRGTGVARAAQWLTITDEDGSTNGSRGRIKNQLRDITGSLTGDDIHHIITEEVLNSLDDPDAANLIDWMQQAATQNNITPTGGATVWHMLSCLQPGNPRQLANPELNWKSYDDWRTFLNQNGGSTHNIIVTAPFGGRTLFEVM